MGGIFSLRPAAYFITCMQKKNYFATLVAAALTLSGCATTVVEFIPKGPADRQVYTSSGLGFSREIRHEMIKNAGEFCEKQNKHFKFVRNVILPTSMAGIDMVSVDLLFACLDEQFVAKPAPLPAEPAPPETAAAEEPAPAPTEPAPGEVIAKAVLDQPPAKEVRVEITGDTPGEVESLGDHPVPAGDLMAPVNHHDVVEEVLLQ